jgi:hypothetical protein
MAEYPQKTSLKVQMRGIQFGSQITHLEESTKTNHPLNRTLVAGPAKSGREKMENSRNAEEIGAEESLARSGRIWNAIP